MWNSLTGELTRKNLESIFLLVGDMEWDIAVPRSTLDTLPSVGNRIKVYTWLQHTEDTMKLFGFAQVQERALFLDLLKVSGVGPKLALKCLSGLAPQQFAAALEAGDATLLSKVPGVGLKTAQKMILALKGKLLLDDSPVSGGPEAELISSLAEMGFDRKAVERVVTSVNAEPDLVGLSSAERERTVFQRALMKLSAEH